MSRERSLASTAQPVRPLPDVGTHICLQSSYPLQVASQLDMRQLLPTFRQFLAAPPRYPGLAIRFPFARARAIPDLVRSLMLIASCFANDAMAGGRMPVIMMIFSSAG